MPKDDVKIVITANTKQAQAALGKLQTEVKQTDKAAKESGKSFDALKAKWLKIAAVAGTTAIAFKKAWDISKEAALYNQAVGAMEKQFGVSSDAILKKLREVSAGTISDTGIIMSANRAMALNVTKDVDEMGSMMLLARVKARVFGMDTTQAFDDMATGVGRGSAQILDNLGINAKGWTDLAKQQGVAYDAQFILKQIQEDAAPVLKRLGELAETDAEKFQIMEAQLSNLEGEIGEALRPTMVAIAETVADLSQWFIELDKETKKLIVQVGGLAVGLGALVAVGVMLGVSFGWMSAIAIAIGLIVAAVKNWDYISKRLVETWLIVKTRIGQAIDFMQKIFWEAASGIISAIQTISQPFVDFINLAIQGYNTITGSNKAMVENIMADSQKMIQQQIADNEQSIILAEEKMMNELGRIDIENAAKEEKEQVHKEKIKALQEKGAEATKANLGKEQAFWSNHLSKTAQKQLAFVNGWLQQGSKMMNKMSEIGNQYYKNKEIQMQNDYNKSVKIIDALFTDEEQNKKAKEALDAKHEIKEKALAYKKAVFEKRMAVARSIMQTSMGVVQALGSSPPPVSFIMAGIVGVMGAIQTALIASQPIPRMAQGGIVQGSAAGTLLVAGEGGKSEAIVPFENETAMEGMAGLGSTNISINVENLYADDEVPMELAKKIDAALFELERRRESRFGEEIAT